MLHGSEDETAVTDALDALCRSVLPDGQSSDPSVFPSELWAALADFGFFAMATPEGFGGVPELFGAAVVLGRHLAPGPIADAFLASQLTGLAEREAVMSGAAVAVLSFPPLVPWGEVASVVIVNDGDRARTAKITGSRAPEATLAGEPWLRTELSVEQDIGPSQPALAVRDVVLTGYI